MLTREDLEKLNWMITRAKKLADGEVDYAVYEPGGAIVGEFFGRVGPDEIRPALSNAALASAAPALALACLEARAALAFAESQGASDDGEGYAREIALLDEALAAAGVEVEP